MLFNITLFTGVTHPDESWGNILEDLAQTKFAETLQLAETFIAGMRLYQ